MKPLHARLLILLAALLAVLPLIVHGTSCGHDYGFHLTNWMEVQRQWKTGVLIPRWSFRAAWGAGEPRFLFYPPLSWMLGALLGSALPWNAVPIAFTWVAIALSGLCMFSFARRYVNVAVSFAAAVLYLANPYMLFTAYERTAYGELLAAAWMPWLLREGMRDDVRAWRLAVPMALLWMSNAPAGVIGSYTLAIVAVLRILRMIGLPLREKGEAINWRAIRILLAQGAGGVLLGLLLASFYLVPAIMERPLVEVQMAVIEGMRPWDNFLFHTGPDVFRNAVIHTASVTALCVLIPGIVFCAITWWRGKGKGRTPAAVCGTILLLILFLVLPASTFIWRHAPQMYFLQFPWRFVSIGGAIAALGFALMFLKDEKPSAGWVSIALACVLGAASITGAAGSFRQYCAQKDRVPALLASVENGEGDWPTDEYTPTPADNDALARDNPPYWLADTAGATAVHDGVAGIITVSTGNPYRTLYFVPANRGRFLVLNHRWFKGWHLRVNGNETAPADTRDDGLTSITLPAGRDAEIELAYRWTPDQWTGLLLSLISLGALSLLRTSERKAA